MRSQQDQSVECKRPRAAGNCQRGCQPGSGVQGGEMPVPLATFSSPCDAIRLRHRASVCARRQVRAHMNSACWEVPFAHADAEHVESAAETAAPWLSGTSTSCGGRWRVAAGALLRNSAVSSSGWTRCSLREPAFALVSGRCDPVHCRSSPRPSHPSRPSSPSSDATVVNREPSEWVTCQSLTRDAGVPHGQVCLLPEPL